MDIFVKPKGQSTNFGYAMWHCRPHIMKEFHQHNDLEINYLVSGYMTYLRGGQLIRVEAGQVGLFWALYPHQTVQMERDTVVRGATIPIGVFLGWGVPEVLGRPLLEGRMIVMPENRFPEPPAHCLERWLHDLVVDDPEHRKVLLLEIEGWLRRLSFLLQENQDSGQESSGDPVPPHKLRSGISHIEAMTRYICENYTEDLTIERIANAVGLHPNYAVNLFRRETGSTLVEFTTRQRLAHAQFLLATTSLEVLEIAYRSGFGSASRFYQAYKRAFGQTPLNYRQMVRLQRLETLGGNNNDLE